jgi:hypothetical protein
MEEQADAYQAGGAQALVVFCAGRIGQARGRKFSLSQRLSWMRTARCGQSTPGLMAAELVKDTDGLLFVLDEFGAPYAALMGAEQAGERLNDEVLSWLQFISVQCPE